MKDLPREAARNRGSQESHLQPVDRNSVPGHYVTEPHAVSVYNSAFLLGTRTSTRLYMLSGISFIFCLPLAQVPSV